MAQAKVSKRDGREPVLKLIEQHAILEHRTNEPGIGDDETDRRSNTAWKVYQKLTVTPPRSITAAADLASHVARMETRHEESEAVKVLRNIAIFLRKLEVSGDGNA